MGGLDNPCVYESYIRLNPIKVGAEMLVEWDESKHHIDFRDATRMFDGPVFERIGRRHGEDRIFAVGLMGDIEIVVVYVKRGKRRRIISCKEGTSR